MSMQDIGSFYSFLQREYKLDSDLQNYARGKGRSFPGGGGVLKFELGTEVRPKVSTTTL